MSVVHQEFVKDANPEMMQRLAREAARTEHTAVALVGGNRATHLAIERFLIEAHEIVCKCGNDRKE
jgi:hypothetical protein